MLIGIKGLVLKVIPRSDHDKLVVLFTHERGKITVCAKGARSSKSKILPCIEPFSYSEFVLYEKDDFFWIREGVLIENFFAIRQDIRKLALASYFCEVLDLVVYENMQELELLRLGLNALYAIASDLRPLETVKTVFELRASLYLGFAPQVERCAICHKKEAKSFYFSLMDAETVCADCREKSMARYYAERGRVSEEESRRFATQIFEISDSMRAAIGYLTECPPDKIFAFQMPDGELARLSKLAEEHLIYRLESKLKTLSFYHEVSD